MSRLRAAAFAIALATAAAHAGESQVAGDRTGPPAVPSNGVEEAPRRGTFAEASVGMFTAMGGSRTFSNAQPYLGLTVGRDLGATASIFASVGYGASNNSCFQPGPQGDCLASDSFGATFVELGGSVGAAVMPRLLLSAKAVLGMTVFSPGPFTNDSGAVRDQMIAPHAGAGVALEYQTHSHFAVGFDTLLRYSLVSRPAGGGKTGIASLALLPRVRYVF
ncbi:MAG TPA: adventurous gliding motility protein CglE [Myxococcales bacterium]|nr:adventurous gliding motility protein CglE [Myxococcales bacterium]